MHESLCLVWRPIPPPGSGGSPKQLAIDAAMSSASSQEGDVAAASEARYQGSQEDQTGDQLRDLTLQDRQASASSLSEAGGEGAETGAAAGEPSTLFEGEVRWCVQVVLQYRSGPVQECVLLPPQAC